MDFQNWLSQKMKNKGKTAQDLALGATSGLLMGADDEVSGAYGALKAGLKGESMGDAYKLNRDRYRAAKAESEASDPYAFGAGNLAGSMAYPGGLTKGASAFGNVVKGALTGATHGALSAAGDAKEIEDVPTDVIRGAQDAGTFSGIMSILGKGKRVPKTKDGAIDFLAVKSKQPLQQEQRAENYHKVLDVWADQVYKGLSKTHPQGTTGGELRDYIMKTLGLGSDEAETVVQKIIDKSRGL